MHVVELLELNFKIPQFQRPYDWGNEQVFDFIEDLRECQVKGNSLFLGLVVLHPDSGVFSIIDGQQRLTTLMLSIAAVGGENKILRVVDGMTRTWVQPRVADISFTTSIINNSSEQPETLSQWLMQSAHKKLGEAKDLSLDTLLNCEVIAYVAPNLAGATRLFERINLRGKKVCEFDLVKNKLIEWAALVEGEEARRKLEEFITRRYDRLYALMDPSAEEQPYNSDKLLRIHWILFSDNQFKSGERVLDKLDLWINLHISSGLSGLVEDYLNSLVQAAEVWVWVERPYIVSRPKYGNELHQALLDFAKLDRDGELQPLIVSSILKFGSKAETLIRFCEINSVRSALARKNSNHGRSIKWRLARQLYNGSLVDGQDRLITTPQGVVHQLFWLNTPYWSKDEASNYGDPFTDEEAASEIIPAESMDDPTFLTRYRSLVHYLFWKYGQYLLAAKDWKVKVSFDINPFQESVWFDDGAASFRKWDIEHIYPRNPDDRETKKGHEFRIKMKDWLNHLGNLTILPISDNRGMGNAVFIEKLEWMREQKKVPFNELLADKSYTGNMMDAPHWGPNNCKKRVQRIREFADIAWGGQAVTDLGVGPYDDRIRGYEEDVSDIEETT
jgi:hypothetical protein